MQQFPIGQSVPHVIGEANLFPIETGAPDMMPMRGPDQSFEEILLTMVAESTSVARQERKIIVNLADETVILPEQLKNAPGLVPPDKTTLSDWTRSDHTADASFGQSPSIELAPMMLGPSPELSSTEPSLPSGTSLMIPTVSRTNLSPASDIGPEEPALTMSSAPDADLKVEDAIAPPSLAMNRGDLTKTVAILAAIPTPKAISHLSPGAGPAEFAAPTASTMPERTRAFVATSGALLEKAIRSAPEVRLADNVGAHASEARASEANVKIGVTTAMPAGSRPPFITEKKGLNGKTFTAESVGTTATTPAGIRASSVGHSIPDDSIPRSRVVPQTTTKAFPPQSPAYAAFEGERVQWPKLGNELDAISDLRANTEVQTAPRGTIDSLFFRPELPRHISQQIMEALQRSASRQADLHLNPVELGRVKISLQTADGSVTVHIAADRPDTADLLRRHLDLLAQELRDIGFHEARFAFADRHPDGDTDERDSSKRHPSNETGDQTASASNEMNEVPPVTLELGDRLDIRI